MTIYSEHNGFRVATSSREIVVRGDRARDGRSFLGAARHADPVRELTRDGDSLDTYGDGRTVTYRRGDVRRVWRTKHGRAIRVGMMLRFGNVTTRIHKIETRNGERYATTKKPGYATTNLFRLADGQPYRVLVFADSLEAVPFED